MSDHFRIDEEGGKHEPTNPKPELGTCERGKYDPSHSAVSHVKNRDCDGWQPLASPQRCPNCGELKSDPTDECIHKFHNHGTPSAPSRAGDEQPAQFDAIRMIYELATILMDDLAPDGQARVCEIRNHIRMKYDESVYE